MGAPQWQQQQQEPFSRPDSYPPGPGPNRFPVPEDGISIDRKYASGMTSQWKRIHDPIGWRRKLDEFDHIAQVNTSQLNIFLNFDF
jgi:hypothetical protein